MEIVLTCNLLELLAKIDAETGVRQDVAKAAKLGETRRVLFLSPQRAHSPARF